MGIYRDMDMDIVYLSGATSEQLLTQRDRIAYWRGHLVAQIRDGIVTHVGTPHLIDDGLAEVHVLQQSRYIDAAGNDI